MTLPELIRYNASIYNVPPSIVAAIILHESGANKWAGRYEEKWFASKLLLRSLKDLCGWTPKPGVNPSLYDEKVWRAHSYGYMQVLGETARALGFTGQYLAELYDPEVNLKYGCMYLGKCFRKAILETATQKELQHRALLFYNGGGNKEYPAMVLKHVDSGGAVALLSEHWVSDE